MEYISKTMASAELSGVFDLPVALRNRRVRVIVLPEDENDIITNEKINYSCNIGFAKGAEIPDSFFEPLSEEDLQLWGL